MKFKFTNRNRRQFPVPVDIFEFADFAVNVRQPGSRNQSVRRSIYVGPDRLRKIDLAHPLRTALRTTI